MEYDSCIYLGSMDGWMIFETCTRTVGSWHQGRFDGIRMRMHGMAWQSKQILLDEYLTRAECRLYLCDTEMAWEMREGDRGVTTGWRQNVIAIYEELYTTDDGDRNIFSNIHSPIRTKCTTSKFYETIFCYFLRFLSLSLGDLSLREWISRAQMNISLMLDATMDFSRMTENDFRTQPTDEISGDCKCNIFGAFDVALESIDAIACYARRS